jgi:mRNA-degrading endonuclease RelE of RelBE toxin-antitoxin system
MEVKLHRKARKFVESRNEPEYSRLKKGLTKLEKDPPEGDIIPLTGKPGQFRTRIGGYRVLFHYHKMIDGEMIILVDDIDNRGQVYKG